MPKAAAASREAKAAEDAEEAGLETGPVPGAQALWKGIQLLDLVADAAEPMRFTDLQKRSGLPKGTLHRMLQTLVDARLLRIEASDQTYRLGARLFEMAHQVWDQFDLRGAAEPELERLAAATGETTRLGLFESGEILYIDQREATQPVRLDNGVGRRAAAHASGLGKAILAHLAPDALHAFLLEADLERLTPNTITDAEALRRELDLTKARGYAVSVEESHVGINSVSAAVLDHRARPLAAIGIVGPAFRLPVDRLHALGRDVMEAARRISGNVGQIAMSISIRQRPLGPDREDVACVFPGTAFLGEGPHWMTQARRLVWVDILAPAIWSGDPATGVTRSLPLDELVGAIVPRRRGGFIAAMQTGIKAIDIETGRTTLLAAPEADKPGNRFNDAKCDAKGRFWAGTLAIDTSPGNGSLHCLDVDGRIRTVARGFHVCNGLGWSPDNRRFYFTDSGRHTIFAYDFDLETGAIENRRVFVEIAEQDATPDGLAVDCEGYVWSAHWDGWCVTRYDPDGKVDRVINLPVPRPTSCVFGGPNHDQLFITSARIRLSAQQLAEAPLSGSVFRFEAGIRGLPETQYGG